MPIKSVSTTDPVSLVRVCAVCKHESSVPLSTLKLGMDVRVGLDPNLIALPACSSCKRTEYLVRTWDKAPGNYPKSHRQTVNALAKFLKDHGQVLPELAATYAAEKTDPPDICTLPVTL